MAGCESRLRRLCEAEEEAQTLRVRVMDAEEGLKAAERRVRDAEASASTAAQLARTGSEEAAEMLRGALTRREAEFEEVHEMLKAALGEAGGRLVAVEVERDGAVAELDCLRRLREVEALSEREARAKDAMLLAHKVTLPDTVEL